MASLSLAADPLGAFLRITTVSQSCPCRFMFPLSVSIGGSASSCACAVFGTSSSPTPTTPDAPNVSGTGSRRLLPFLNPTPSNPGGTGPLAPPPVFGDACSCVIRNPTRGEECEFVTTVPRLVWVPSPLDRRWGGGGRRRGGCLDPPPRARRGKKKGGMERTRKGGICAWLRARTVPAVPSTSDWAPQQEAYAPSKPSTTQRRIGRRP